MTYETHDSGERAEYSSGMVRDTNKGKPRFDLCLPLDVPHEEQMLTRWAALMARGALKYDPRNWEKASGEEELNRFRESAFRHLVMWLNGVNDGEDHAAAVFFNITAAEYVKRKLKGAELRERWEKVAARYKDGSAWQRVEIIDLEPKRIEPGGMAFAKKIVTALNDYKRRGGRIA